ncbi:MAG: SH3 domain-containing protein [Desulfobacteraceae bacterium]|nr:SH3 domain-containing protein [Desulfobacteraceae bacterium]MCF8095185.1 SH3 domain-containing protein [Desulfobacteraceae bacterium]
MILTKRLNKYRAIPFLLFLLILGAASAAAAQQRMAVSVDVANIRSGPGTEHEQLWRVERYTPIKVLDSQDGWYFFEDFEGTKGWIHKDLVSDTNSVITKKGLINIRKGPGTDYEVAFQAEKGVPFKVMEKKGDWIHIQHADGEKGWIYGGLVW